LRVTATTGLRHLALVLAYLLTRRRRSEVLNLRWHLRSLSRHVPIESLARRTAASRRAD
jgi:hypothetical protein